MATSTQDVIALVQRACEREDFAGVLQLLQTHGAVIAPVRQAAFDSLAMATAEDTAGCIKAGAAGVVEALLLLVCTLTMCTRKSRPCCS
jgi:hypothetical protein